MLNLNPFTIFSRVRTEAHTEGYQLGLKNGLVRGYANGFRQRPLVECTVELTVDGIAYTAYKSGDVIKAHTLKLVFNQFPDEAEIGFFIR